MEHIDKRRAICEEEKGRAVAFDTAADAAPIRRSRRVAPGRSYRDLTGSGSEDDEVAALRWAPANEASKPTDAAVKPADEAVKPPDAASKPADEASKPADEAAVKSTNEASPPPAKPTADDITVKDSGFIPPLKGLAEANAAAQSDGRRRVFNFGGNQHTDLRNQRTSPFGRKRSAEATSKRNAARRNGASSAVEFNEFVHPILVQRLLCADTLRIGAAAARLALDCTRAEAARVSAWT
ncbi:hypothetical protein M885DRAFT_579603 [Pelagophyceae sp. CCMP2097]|nr:hypothetical protein M885DRAFT_579603 [Pelagophyceae sp. CCMP2097]